MIEPTWIACGCGLTRRLPDQATAADLSCPRCGATSGTVEKHPEAAGRPDSDVLEK